MLDLNNIIKYTNPLSLLYVEDNEAAREETTFVFEDLFENIYVANDGQEGLASFKKNEIDLIITDVEMPHLNGLEMIKEIRKLNTEVPILVLSAHSDTDFFMESIRLGVDGYLLKPIDMNQFVDMLKKVTLKLKLQNDADRNLHFLNQYQEATDKNSIVSKADLSGNITHVNDAFCKISGYTKEELLGQSHNTVRHPDNPKSLYEEMWDTIKTKKDTWHGLLRNRDKDGNSYYVKTIIKPILDMQGEIVEYISLRDDITDIMSQKKQLHDLVDTSKEFLIVLMKIENFDDIEKFYGSILSENIENKFSQEICSIMSKECKYYKSFVLGDGEYALVRKREVLEDDIEEITKRLKELQLDISNSKIDVGDVDYDISVLLSVAYGENAFENAKYGLKQMIKSKQDFIIANDLVKKEHDEAKKNLQTIKMVKRAIEDFKIVSYFQPIINNKTKKISKYESLVRLVDTDGEVLSPFFFLDIAKRGKYYSQITERVLENSFNTLKNTNVDISINISVLDIEKPLTREKIFTILKANSKDLNRVVFELLEDEEVKDFELIKSFIVSVKKMGVRIAIDDFGAGYSNFERLLAYQPDILKIDGSLVKNIVSDKYALDVVETIVSFARKQDIKTVAEYVENENIFNMLDEIGVDYSQGYYFGKPEPLL